MHCNRISELLQRARTTDFATIRGAASWLGSERQVRVLRLGKGVPLVAKRASTLTAIFRGFRGRCPRCGQGQLLHHYIKMVDRCSICGEPYGHYRTDDAAPWLTILVVGHLTVPVVLVCEMNFQMPLALAFAIYLPLIVGLTLFLLPRCKGIMASMLWATKAEGSEKI